MFCVHAKNKEDLCKFMAAEDDGKNPPRGKLLKIDWLIEC